MADGERIRRKIAEIAERRNNVTLEEVAWVVQQLGQYYPVGVRAARHGKLFRIGSRRFMANAHNPGGKNLKRYSVDDFIDAVTALGWYKD